MAKHYVKSFMCIISFKHPNNTQVLSLHFIDEEAVAQVKKLSHIHITSKQQN